MQEWRNWQTRRLQVPVVARSCGFKSHLLHSFFIVFLSRMPLHSCCEMRVMQCMTYFFCASLQVYTPFRSAQNHCPPDNVRPAGGYIRWEIDSPTDTDLLLATYRGGSHLTSDIKKSSHGTAELVIFKTYFRGFAILLRGRQ